jgi:hypothetical protein
MSASPFEMPRNAAESSLPQVDEASVTAEHHNTTADKARFGGTLLLTSVLSYDFVPLIAMGENLKNSGLNGWVAAGVTALVTTVETTAASYTATAGIGDFKYEPKSKIGKSLTEITPLVSLMRGAPTGVALDAAAGKKVDLKRRLVHAIPYGTAVGFWVTPNPLSETVVGTVAETPKAIYDTAKDHPQLSGGLALGATLTAAALLKRRKAHKH